MRHAHTLACGMPACYQASGILTCQGAVQREAIQVPELNGLIRGGGRQLAHVRAQEALQDVGPWQGR